MKPSLSYFENFQKPFITFETNEKRSAVTHEIETYVESQTNLQNYSMYKNKVTDIMYTETI